MLIASLAIRVTRPGPKPSRCRTTSNTGRLVIVATRPHISAYVAMPITPIGTVQSSW
jgi:hypothetical protein